MTHKTIKKSYMYKILTEKYQKNKILNFNQRNFNVWSNLYIYVSYIILLLYTFFLL